MEHFLSLLRQHGIEAIADVRFMPYSRHVPHFNPASITTALSSAGIVYVPLGKELGARPDDPDCFVNGRVSHERLAARPAFREGLERVVRGATKYRLAVMCTEKDPLDCHRMTLICRHVRSSGLALLHILADSALETNAEAERRLCRRLRLQPDLLEDEAAIIERAYDRQSERIAYTR
jgi:uncharacterized protein (DUF488 family)